MTREEAKQVRIGDEILVPSEAVDGAGVGGDVVATVNSINLSGIAAPYFRTSPSAGLISYHLCGVVAKNTREQG